MIANRTTINKRWTILKYLGLSTDIEVYEAVDNRTGEKVGAKVTNDSTNNGILRREMHMYGRVRCSSSNNNQQIVPRVLSFIRKGNYEIMFVELLGSSLQTLFQDMSNHLSTSHFLQIFNHALTCLEHLHEVGLVHRDIKPSTICLGRGNRIDGMRLTDIGLASVYCDGFTGIHVGHRFRADEFSGSSRYASLNQHLGGSPNRAEDLESLCYTMMYLYNGSVPWTETVKRFMGGMDKMKVAKKWKSKTAKRICRGLPPFFCRYLQFVREIPFGTDPNYVYLHSILGDAMKGL